MRIDKKPRNENFGTSRKNSKIQINRKLGLGKFKQFRYTNTKTVK